LPTIFRQTVEDYFIASRQKSRQKSGPEDGNPTLFANEMLKLKEKFLLLSGTRKHFELPY
jgi:hypothetical protein